MQYGSLQVSEGEQVTVGTVVGHTGNTGRSYGAHLHFELLVNGTTAIDPLPWLREHAGGLTGSSRFLENARAMVFSCGCPETGSAPIAQW